jgi:hypothetical protein
MLIIKKNDCEIKKEFERNRIAGKIIRNYHKVSQWCMENTKNAKKNYISKPDTKNII